MQYSVRRRFHAAVILFFDTLPRVEQFRVPVKAELTNHVSLAQGSEYFPRVINIGNRELL